MSFYCAGILSRHPRWCTQTRQQSSASVPDQRDLGFWSTVFGNQPFGVNSSKAGPPFAFNAAAMQSIPPYASGGPDTSNGVPPVAHSTGGPHVQQQQQPHRQQSGQSSNGQGIGSTSNYSHSTSPELANAKTNLSSSNGAPDEKPKKTRKRQQTSCSECHRRKQKCNQVGHYCLECPLHSR